MAYFFKLRDFEKRFDTMDVEELKRWRVYWMQHAQGLAPKVRKLAMKRVHEIEKAIERRSVAPYCATKWAIEGLTQSLAQELPPGLAAVALNPGIINTDMLRSCFGGGASSYPTAEGWAKTAVPFLLKINVGNNGEQLTAPG